MYQDKYYYYPNRALIGLEPFEKKHEESCYVIYTDSVYMQFLKHNSLLCIENKIFKFPGDFNRYTDNNGTICIPFSWKVNFAVSLYYKIFFRKNISFIVNVKGSFVMEN